MDQKHNRFLLFILLLLIFLTQFPYEYADWHSNQFLMFGGFLFNPLDGNTYLSKMRQGWEGKWLFELTYSPEKNQPAFLFVFYLFLGHTSKILHLDLLTTYHLARLLACLVLLLAVKNFFQWLFDDRKIIEFAIFWTMFGAGLGWLVVPFGGFPPDFWIAEGYVFLSAFANPHFPFAMAIMVWTLTLSQKELERPRNLWIALFSGVALANLSPFAWIITSIVLGSYFLLSYPRADALSQRMIFLKLMVFGLGGIPFLAYQFWITRHDLVLFEWNRQNVTPSPNLGELFIGYLPLAVWAIWGMVRGHRLNDTRYSIPTIWVIVSLILVYLPSPLQRRFLIGLYIPLVALAMFAFQGIEKSRKVQSKSNPFALWLRLSLALSLVSNLVILLVTFQAIRQRDSTIFLYREEVEAFRWLEGHLPKDSVVLAAPASGSFIPAWTGLRVVYGHPFESIYATERKNLVEKFYRGQMSQQELKTFLADYSVDVILWGIRERDISTVEMQDYLENTYPIGYYNVQVTVYRAIP
ncbi:MAG: hypothetical protein N3D16_02470 [Anaerolineales bacterium]|nr:hypothetical protein [Anaerolineales bacterium]